MLNWIVWNRTVIYIKMDLAMNKLQRLICHKTQQPNITYLGRRILFSENFVNIRTDKEGGVVIDSLYAMILKKRKDWVNGDDI